MGEPPELVLSNLGCDIWQGTINQSHQRTSPGVDELSTLTATVVFAYDDAASEGGFGFPQIYTLQSGSFTYSSLANITFGQTPCRVLRTASGAIAPNPYTPGVETLTAASLTFIVGFTFPGETGVHYLGSGSTEARFTTVDNCNTDRIDITTVSDSRFSFWSGEGEVSVDGKTIRGSTDIPDGDGSTIHWDWHFTHK